MKRFEVITVNAEVKKTCAFVKDTSANSHLLHPKRRGYYEHEDYEPYNLVVVDLDSEVKSGDHFMIKGDDNVYFAMRDVVLNNAVKVHAFSNNKSYYLEEFSSPFTVDFIQNFCDLYTTFGEVVKYCIEENGEFKLLKPVYTLEEIELLAKHNDSNEVIKILNTTTY